MIEVTGWRPLSTSMNMVKFKLQYGGSKRSVTLWDSPSCEKGSQAGLSVPIRQLVCAREMEVRLQALHSVSIRRKKPWGKFAWLGEVGRRELYMLDAPRVSTLSLEDGHTKKTVPALSKMATAIKILSYSSDGSLMCGLLENGNLFLWMPGSEGSPVFHTTPLNGLKMDANDWKGVRVLVAPSGKSLLLVVNPLSLLFVTAPRMDPQFSQAALSWWRVKTESSDLKVKLTHQKEAAMDAAFVEDEVYGPCWLVLWAYSCAPTAGVPDIVVCHLRIQVMDVQAQLAQRLHMTFNTTSADDDKGLLHEVAQEEAAGGSEGGEGVTGVPSSVLPTACSPVRGGRSEALCPFSSMHWRCTEYPLAELCGETGTHIKGRGSLVVKMSAEGKIAAVVVNCRSAEACRVVYVSLESDRTISAPVYDCTQPGDTGRSWWIADAAWTPCGTFLVAVSKRGSLMLFPRLSGPTLASVSGCSLDMGPCTHLPIHPLVIAQASSQEEPPSYETSLASEKDVMRQQFSVTIHPRLPLVLVSDGYHVTVLRLPHPSSPEEAARTMVYSVQRLLLAEHPEVAPHFLPEDNADATTTKGRNIQALVEGSFLSSEDHAMGSVAPYTGACGVGGENEGIIHFSGLAEYSTGGGTTQTLSHSSAHAPASTRSLELLLSALACVVSSDLPLEPPEHPESENVPTLVSFQSLWTATCGVAIRLTSSQGNIAVFSDFLSRLQELARFDSLHHTHLALTSSLLASTLSLCIECSLECLKHQVFQSSDPSQTVAKFVNVLHAAFNAFSYSLGACASTCKVSNGGDLGCTPIPMDVVASNISALPTLVSAFTCFHSRVTDTLHLLKQYQLEQHPHNTLLQAMHAVQQLLEQLVQVAEQYGISIPQPVVAKDANRSELCDLLGKLLQYDISGAVKDVALKIKTNEGLPVEGLGELFHSTATQLLAPHRQGVSNGSPVGGTANPAQITLADTRMVCLANPVGESMVKNLGFLMAQYFLGLPLLVPSCDSACGVPGPSVAITKLPQGAKFNELSSAKVTDAVKEQQAQQHWTPECALALLLFAGEWEEAAHLSLQLGNWQLAYCVTSVKKAHNALLQHKVSTPLSNVQLDDIAMRIIRGKIEALTKALVSTESHPRLAADKEHSLTMILQAAAVGCHDNVVVQLAAHLVDSTVSEVGKLLYLVPAEHHLPASPVFCQQRPFAKEDDRAEYDARVTISTLVLQFFSLLRAANCLQPCFALHTAQLSGILQATEESGTEVGHPSVLMPRRQAESWERYLQLFQQLSQRFPHKAQAVETASLNQLSALLKRLLLALWYLHARDQLSALLRRSIYFSLNASLDDSGVLESTVVWGLKLLCVSRYFGYNSTHKVEDCVLTALAEMDPTELKATLLAHGFSPSDFDGRNDAVGSKFARIVAQLRAKSVGNGVDADGGEAYSSKDPLSVVYIMRSKSLASARQAMSLPLHWPDARTQHLPVCESEFDVEYLHFLSTAAEHTSATHVTGTSPLYCTGVHPFLAADTPLLSDFCIWSGILQNGHQQSLDEAISESRVKQSITAPVSTPTDYLWPQLLPVAQFFLHWSDVTVPMVSESSQGPITNSKKVSLPLEALCSALHIREMKILGEVDNVNQGTGGSVDQEDGTVTEEQPKHQSMGSEVQEVVREPLGGDCSLTEHANSTVMTAASKPLLLTLPQEQFALDDLREIPGMLATVSKAADSLPQLALLTDTFTEFSFGEAVSLLTAEELSCTVTAVPTQGGDSEEEEDQQDSTTLSAVTTLTSEPAAGVRHHSRTAPATSGPPVRYATGELSSNPSTESWTTLVSLSEGGQEAGKGLEDTGDSTMVTEDCSTDVREDEVNLVGSSNLVGGHHKGGPIDWNGANEDGGEGYEDGVLQGQGGSGNGGCSNEGANGGGAGREEGRGEGREEGRGGGGGGGGGEVERGGGGGRGGGGRGGGKGGTGGRGRDDNGGSGSLHSTSESHSETSSDRSSPCSSQSEHTKQHVVPIKSSVADSVHPHTWKSVMRQDTPEQMTTTTDLSRDGDHPGPLGKGGLPELPVSAVKVETSGEGEQDARKKQTLKGPPQSTPLEDVPQHPYPETQVVGKRTKGPNSPASPHLPAAPHDTADCHQQEQLEGTTARFATLKTDELNSPTYHTWSSERSSGHPVVAQDLKAVQPVDESGLVGGAKEVALLRRDVRKVVKQEMRAIVRELIKGSHDRRMTALDSSVSEAVPTQSVPPAGNLSHAAKVGQVAHKQSNQESHGTAAACPLPAHNRDQCSKETIPTLTPAHLPGTSEDLSHSLHTATSTKQSGVLPLLQNTQGMPSCGQDVFTLAPLVPSRAPTDTDNKVFEGNANPATVRTRARASSFSESVPCAEDTTSCVSVGERYSFQSELEPSLSELTPGQLDEAGSGQSQVPRHHPLHKSERDASNLQSGTAYHTTRPPVLPHMQGLHVSQVGSLPQLSLIPQPEEAVLPSGIIQTNCLPQISLTTHRKSHTLQSAHEVGEGKLPQHPLPLHSALFIPHDIEASPACHQVSSLNTAPGCVPVPPSTFPQLGGTQQAPPSLVFGTGAQHLPPPPKEAWATKTPTSVPQQLQEPWEHKGAKDEHGTPFHSATFPLLALAPKQQQEQSWPQLQLRNELMHSQFPDVYFPPLKQCSASDLPLLSLPDIHPTEKHHQAPDITCASMPKPPRTVSEPFRLLQLPLQPFVPSFPPPDVLGLQPIQLQNVDPFHRHHQEGFKMLDLSDDMPAHGPPVHVPLSSEYLHPAHPRHGARSRRAKETCTEVSVSSAGDTERRRRKGRRARRKPVSSDSQASMAKAEDVTSRKVVVKQTAEASLQVSFDFRHEDLNSAHPSHEQHMTAKAPEISKQQKQFYTGVSNTDMKHQFAGLKDCSTRQLTEVEGVVEEEMGAVLAQTSQEVTPGQPSVVQSNVETHSQVNLFTTTKCIQPARPTQEQQMMQQGKTVLLAGQTTASPRDYNDWSKPGKEPGEQEAGGGGPLVVHGSEEVPLIKHNSAALLLGQPNGVPAREFLLVEDIDPEDTMITDGGDGESTPRDGGFTPVEPLTTSSMSESSEGAPNQHVMGASSRDVPRVVTSVEPQLVRSPHLAFEDQAGRADDVLSKLRHVEAQLNALEAAANNMQREIKLDSYKLMGELEERTAHADSCGSSVDGVIDVKKDRATYLKCLPHDHNQRDHLRRRASSGSLERVNLPMGQEELQRQPHHKQRTRSLPGAPLHQRNRVELRQWMEERRKRRHEKFKSERDSRISKERRPFVPPEQTGIQRNQRERLERRRELLEEHRERRVHDAYALMADIIHHQPKSSQEDSKENYRQSTLASGTRVLSHPPVPSIPARRANRPLPSVGTTWRKSTGSSSSSLPVGLREAVKHHHVGRKPLRKIASVEGLTEEEVETITRLLKDVEDDSASTTSSVLTDIDWTEVDDILDH